MFAERCTLYIVHSPSDLRTHSNGEQRYIPEQLETARSHSTPAAVLASTTLRKQNINCMLLHELQANHQSHKNPVSALAMLTGKFLQIRKVFATSSLLAEEFPDTLQYKISR